MTAPVHISPAGGKVIRALGGTIVVCYGCPTEFRTSSIAPLAKQLKLAGWQIQRTWKGNVYRCPEHAR